MTTREIIVEARTIAQAMEFKNRWIVLELARRLELVTDIDAVPVVRCKDCEAWARNSGLVDSPNGHCFYHCIDTNGFDFCSYGTKRDGKDDKGK